LHHTTAYSNTMLDCALDDANENLNNIHVIVDLLLVCIIIFVLRKMLASIYLRIHSMKHLHKKQQVVEDVKSFQPSI